MTLRVIFNFTFVLPVVVRLSYAKKELLRGIDFFLLGETDSPNGGKKVRKIPVGVNLETRHHFRFFLFLVSFLALKH